MNRLGHYVLQYCLIIGAWLLVITGVVTAENLTVSLQVGLSSFTVSGYTAPNAMVTIKQNGVVAGTTTASASGTFNKTIEALEPDTYTFHIFSADSEDKVGNTVEYIVAIGENQNLSLDNLLLPPTLTLETLDTSVGEDVRLRGEAYPGSTIRLFLADSLMATYPAGTDGRWYGLISTANRAAGEYHVYAHTSHVAGYQSIPSIGYTLTLRPRVTVTEIPSPTSTIPSPRGSVPDLSPAARPASAAQSPRAPPPSARPCARHRTRAHRSAFRA